MHVKLNRRFRHVCSFVVFRSPRKCCTCQIRPLFSTCSNYSGVSRRDQILHSLRSPHLVRQMLTVLQIERPRGLNCSSHQIGSSHSPGLKSTFTCILNGFLSTPILFFSRTTSKPRSLLHKIRPLVSTCAPVYVFHVTAEYPLRVNFIRHLLVQGDDPARSPSTRASASSCRGSPAPTQ